MKDLTKLTGFKTKKIKRTLLPTLKWKQSFNLQLFLYNVGEKINENKNKSFISFYKTIWSLNSIKTVRKAHHFFKNKRKDKFEKRILIELALWKKE